MCVTFTSEIIITDKDIIAYKVCRLIKSKFYSSFKPNNRWYQNINKNINIENNQEGTYLEYKIGHQNISSFNTTPGIYLFKRSLNNINIFRKENKHIFYDKEKVIILKVLIPKSTKIRYGKFGWCNYITINAEKIIPLYSMPVY